MIMLPSTKAKPKTAWVILHACRRRAGLRHPGGRQSPDARRVRAGRSGGSFCACRCNGDAFHPRRHSTRHRRRHYVVRNSAVQRCYLPLLRLGQTDRHGTGHTAPDGTGCHRSAIPLQPPHFPCRWTAVRATERLFDTTYFVTDRYTGCAEAVLTLTYVASLS